MDATLRCPGCPTEIHLKGLKISFKSGGGMFCSVCDEPLMKEKNNE